MLGELWHCQRTEGYISAAAIERLAHAHQLAAIEVEGVASFYHFFHRSPGGKHTIYLNNSIISEVKGFENVKNAFEKETGTRIGSVDPTRTFGLFTTPCIGLSDQEPAALIDFYPFVNLDEKKVQEIVQQLRQGKKAADICDVPQDNIRYLPENNGSILFAPYTPGEAVGILPSLRPEGVISLIREAEIRGRGGAFFQTWRKWEACQKQPASPKFIICNADEGEPGTFKDRVLLNSQTGSVLEGMIIAGYTVGARYGIIYLRGEYQWLKAKIQQTIDAFRANGWLGVHIGGIKGFQFDIRIEMGAGAYVCGEETALLESMAGSDAVCLRELTASLCNDHRQLEQRWAVLRRWLLQVAQGAASTPADVARVFNRKATVFVLMPDPPPQGSRVECVLVHPVDHGEVMVMAEVVRVGTTLAGTGVELRFDPPPPALRGELIEFVRRGRVE